jgi:hypothetical protein
MGGPLKEIIRCAHPYSRRRSHRSIYPTLQPFRLQTYPTCLILSSPPLLAPPPLPSNFPNSCKPFSATYPLRHPIPLLSTPSAALRRFVIPNFAVILFPASPLSQPLREAKWPPERLELPPPPPGGPPQPRALRRHAGSVWLTKPDWRPARARQLELPVLPCRPCDLQLRLRTESAAHADRRRRTGRLLHPNSAIGRVTVRRPGAGGHQEPLPHLHPRSLPLGEHAVRPLLGPLGRPSSPCQQ